MSDQNNSQTSYVPDVKRSKGISPLWLLPILTMVLAGWLVVKSIHDAGQRVQIYFSDAAGLVAGRTTIRYQGLKSVWCVTLICPKISAAFTWMQTSTLKQRSY